VIGSETLLGSEHNCAQQVENARTCEMVAVGVRARSVVGKTIMSSCASPYRDWVTKYDNSAVREWWLSKSPQERAALEEEIAAAKAKLP
jgi:hypothetical protein